MSGMLMWSSVRCYQRTWPTAIFQYYIHDCLSPLRLFVEDVENLRLANRKLVDTFSSMSVEVLR